MALTSGTKLGPYEIQSPLGAGGMGEVYRARDSRLDREVAIKVLPAEVASDPVLKQRLEREARAVSKISHPHICTLHDIGHQDGVDFLVMELVEGETLEHRLAKGPLPPEQVIRYGAQIADALSKAHKQGFTHRDLKSSNIMLTKSGAKLMDFGLAKQSDHVPVAAALREITAEQSKLTSDGMLVGTFQYMAPEQLEGKEADARTDIFALGEVLYEMLTGKPAFSGKSKASLIAAILTNDPPPITQLQPLTPPALERIIKQCLAKDPDDRWQSASDLASELKWISDNLSQTTTQPAMVRTLPHARIAWVVAALAVCATSTFTIVQLREKALPAPVIRSLIMPEEGTTPLFTGDFAGPMVISPDASAVAFIASAGKGAPLLWVRKLKALHAHAVSGTEGATFPFWSPDSRSLGFFAGGKLKTVLADGGTPFEVCEAPTPRGGTWSSKGIIVFAPGYLGTVSQVPATGGVPRPVTVLDRSKHDSHRWPRFLPDGEHFLYLAVSHSGGVLSNPNDGIYFASLDGKENHFLLHGFTEAVYASGRLLYERDGVLMVQRFDPGKGALQGEAERLAEDVLQDSTTWNAAFDASGSALLAYASGGLVPAQPKWYDRIGKELGAAGPKAFNLNAVRLSPDGTRVASESGEATGDVWVYDLKRGVNTRFTFGGAGASSSPVWSPDGLWIAYIGIRTPTSNSLSKANAIYRKPANGGGQEELLLEGDNTNRVLDDWSPDGKSLLFTTGDTVATGQIWMLEMNGQHKPVPLVQGDFVASLPRFSPDGHWIAYSSTESGRSEVYVIPFGGGTGKWQISNTGGSGPVWRHDGKELFYWSPDNSLMSVSLTLKPGVVQVGSTQTLAHWNSPIGSIGLSSPLDVTKDGQRFLVVAVGQQPSRPIILVTNWDTELKK
jgi:eukaryotic-like serine/threonine-protein kinase